MSVLFNNLVKEIQAADNRPRKVAIETAKDMVHGRVPVSLNFWYVNGKAIIEALEKVLDEIDRIEMRYRTMSWLGCRWNDSRSIEGAIASDDEATRFLFNFVMDF